MASVNILHDIILGEKGGKQRKNKVTKPPLFDASAPVCGSKTHIDVATFKWATINRDLKSVGIGLVFRQNEKSTDYDESQISIRK